MCNLILGLCVVGLVNSGPNVYILEIMGNSGVVEEYLMVKLPRRISTEISEVE